MKTIVSTIAALSLIGLSGMATAEQRLAGHEMDGVTAGAGWAYADAYIEAYGDNYAWGLANTYADAGWNGGYYADSASLAETEADDFWGYGESIAASTGSADGDTEAFSGSYTYSWTSAWWPDSYAYADNAASAIGLGASASSQSSVYTYADAY
ncbi:MAG: hypothetical protein EOM91_07540 [Sphingobacteriia bacterium]|nr:hypothetical protein [Sphingobacteriia bacterium]NCC40539.1 hypothetical protein [Gammaproteobacteria bacterium]